MRKLGLIDEVFCQIVGMNPRVKKIIVEEVELVITSYGCRIVGEIIEMQWMTNSIRSQFNQSYPKRIQYIGVFG